MSIERDIKQIRKDLNKLIEQLSCCPAATQEVSLKDTEQTATQEVPIIEQA